MDISAFIKKYGTLTSAVMLRHYADTLVAAEALREMADDLQNALETYAADDVEG